MITDRVFLVKPHKFQFNVETAADNVFQSNDGDFSADEIQKRAAEEFENAVALLRGEGIHVDVLEDFDDTTPDSIFPNNVIVTFPGKIMICEMYSDNRNLEYNKLKPQLEKIVNYKKIEKFDFRNDEKKVLEGTGALVLDRENKIAYATLSKRCDEGELDKFCETFGFKKVAFKSEQDNKPVYHTNVIMTLAEKFVMIADELIVEGREEVLESLRESGKEIIHLTEEEILNFAGNSIELKGRDKNILVISEMGLNALSEDKIKTIEKYDKILAINVDTISHYGGGAIRCMICENFL
ncbi:amidinotransferase [Peptoniphilus sp. MSJ-1]|uniref:Amidinotransferase n=1 Tax=Peptoniphilus ovalis TaxID=2841503 RepID=A0ABS6FED9_9FIRM|nr:arginine deiminase-related protein [Peptoniphilus ovalis]MBU5668541.1 amidinotransferase [Peptoniphilus ovalis]